MSPNRLRVLSIAGSDCSGGAGIQADLKTFAAHGAYGMSVITAVTAQNTVEVRGIQPVSAELVAQQIDAVFDDIGVDAIKIGMLLNRSIIAAVAKALEKHHGPPIVLDTVMVSKSGGQLLQEDAVESLGKLMVPLATIITPNLPEAAQLSGMPVTTSKQREEVARKLANSRQAVLLKGGHAEGDEVCDLLASSSEVVRIEHPRIATTSTHGTGCTLSSALAVRLASGVALEDAVRGAIRFTTGAISAAVPMGQGAGPLDHLFGLRVYGEGESG